MTRLLKKLPVALIAALSAAATFAQPAAILDGYNADPAIRVFGDTYYIYPTTDKPRWSSNEFSVWASTDLIHWANQGVVMNLPRSVAWGPKSAWAPDCVERKGTYYFYFTASEKIGVATASSPLGPFKDALGKPLLEPSHTVHVGTIAPHVFIDDDGQAYLYYGNSKNQGFVQAVLLNPDMTSFDGDPVNIPITSFREGLVVFKRKGVYYFMWTAAVPDSRTYTINYGMADTALGSVISPASPVVLSPSRPVVGIGYHDVINIPGTDRWYLVYTRQAIPNGAGDRRQVCLARMEFNADGSIKPINPLEPAFAPGDPGEPLVHGSGRR